MLDTDMNESNASTSRALLNTNVHSIALLYITNFCNRSHCRDTAGKASISLGLLAHCTHIRRVSLATSTDDVMYTYKYTTSHSLSVGTSGPHFYAGREISSWATEFVICCGISVDPQNYTESEDINILAVYQPRQQAHMGVLGSH